jgi:hypothetical protein
MGLAHTNSTAVNFLGQLCRHAIHHTLPFLKSLHAENGAYQAGQRPFICSPHENYTGLQGERSLSPMLQKPRHSPLLMRFLVILLPGRYYAAF